MKPIITLTDKEVFPELFHDPKEWRERQTVKALIVDNNNNIALVGNKWWRLLPGGGVEQNETHEEAVGREAMEEVGCNITDIQEFACTEDFRNKDGVHQITHFFTAKLDGEKGEPTTTQDDEQGMKVDWLTLDEAINLLEREVREIPPDRYNSHFNVRTHLAALREAKKLNLVR